LSKSSKYSVGEDRRRQRRFNVILLSAAFLVTVIVIAYAFTYTTSLPPVILPDYLKTCIPATGQPVYVSTPTIQILINGQSQTIPPNIGVSGSCIRPINTRGPVGVIHIDAFENRTYTLGDFFLVWGATYGPTYAIFSKNQIFNFKTDPNHNITISVNNYPIPNPPYQDFPLPKNANVSSPQSQLNILISYA